MLLTWSLHSHIHNHSHQEGLSSSPLTKQHLASVKESIRYNVNEHLLKFQPLKYRESLNMPPTEEHIMPLMLLSNRSRPWQWMCRWWSKHDEDTRAFNCCQDQVL